MHKIIKMLKAGGLILSPTDTIWGILCDASNPRAVEKVYDLKKRIDSKAMVCIVSDIEMLKRHIGELPQKLDHYINDQRPTTVIYNNPKGTGSKCNCPRKYGSHQNRKSSFLHPIDPGIRKTIDLHFSQYQRCSTPSKICRY